MCVGKDEVGSSPVQTRRGQDQGFRRRSGKTEGHRAEVRKETAEQSTAHAITVVAERMIRRGMDGDGIAEVTGYDRNRIDAIARRMNRTVNWARAQV